MFLKTIEMQGFKSFADKTRVDFDRGVTAVVGPNGSGKSNITESLRWALGESSAKSLRGGKMPDVIFAGTQNRKPLNYASVTVVLDNSDDFIASAGEEIRVERHIYRNGDSEYLIDGKKVRLRDIHDLFMDTGLGRDSFSIISQGRVEAIFNSKPEERRAIFEEAAGVLKYKTRKKETETKLSQTQDNLDRLEDIIYELDNQLKPLEKQANTARQFQVLEEERLKRQFDLLVHDITTFSNHRQQLNVTLAGLKDQLSNYYHHRDQLEAENQSFKDKRHRLTDELNNGQESLLQLTRLIADLERQIDLLNLESNQKQEKKSETTARLAQMEDRKSQLLVEKERLEAKLAELKEGLLSTKSRIENLETQLATFSTNPDQIIDRLREEYVSLMSKEADMSNQLTAVTSEIERQQQVQASKSHELQQLAQEKKTLETELATAKEAHDDAVAKVQDLLSAYQTQSNDLEQASSSYRKEQTSLFDLMDQLKTKEARQNSLLAIQKSHSNFYAGVKAVLQASERLGGIIGAVSDHVTFDRTYQTAIEIALGGASQHVIVEDEAAAKRSIDFLKQQRSGRATFLPLTTIKPREVAAHHRTKLQSTPGFLGFASDLVTYDGKLRVIFENLLGTIAIFESIDAATQAAKAVHYQVRMVTLDGSEIRPGGAFAGGSNRQNNTTFIKPELDALDIELQSLNHQLKAQEKVVAELKLALDSKESVLSQTKEAGEAARLTEQATQFSYQQVSERFEQVTQLLETLQTSQGEGAMARLIEEKAELESKLVEIASEKETVNARLEQIRNDKESITETVSQLNDQLAQARLSEREQLSEERFEKVNLQRLFTEVADLEKEMATLKIWLESDATTVEVEQLPVLQAQLSETASKKEALEQRQASTRIALEDAEGALSDIEEQLQKASQKNEALIREQAKVEAELSTISEKLQGFAQQLAEDYHMSFEEAKETAETIDNLEMDRQRLADLIRQIRALGSVNLEAIAQFDDVSERLTFLNSQRDDLINAKNLLLDTINDMDDEVKARFKATFDAIRESFKQTFTQMFGGGSADLILTEGDLLTSGVEISVQPPGKKIQSLNLMSGGEKALSALALLFAIIRVKTIPFVILDEVEAALDEANVKRFGDYLNRFDKDSQFIVVTHRKGTMAAADSIYGVTMQESGVSKIVSVKLKEAETMVN